ncbi:MAG: peptidoglycan-binding protein, partial [Acidobacteriota bacterium]
MKKYLVTLALVAAIAFPGAAPAASCPTITGELKFGSKGSQVTALQVFLKSQGYFKATSVPNFGNATLASVRAFQKAHKISQTGTVGPLTRAKIKTLCSGSSSSTGGGSAPVSSDGIIPAPSNSIFEVTGWIPYWRQATGTADTLPHLSKMTEVNPFTYTVKSDGTLADNGPMNAEPWLSFNIAAKAQGVRVIPTIMTSGRELVHELLSDPAKRIAFETHIAETVRANNFDGIDIDFEGKSSNTRDYFSMFLKGLKQKLGDKWLMCTIETRIPDADRYY